MAYPKKETWIVLLISRFVLSGRQEIWYFRGINKVEMKRIIYIALGSLCVGLGTIGIFVPGLPTTPFMLAASWLFYRSSPRLREKLLASWLGAYIRDYEKNKGLTPRTKIMAIIMMVGMSTLSITQFIDKLCVRIIVAIACLIGVVVVGFIVPTVKRQE